VSTVTEDTAEDTARQQPDSGSSAPDREPTDALRDQVHDAARRARVAADRLGQLRRSEKDAALLAMAEALRERTAEILAATRTWTPACSTG
jgi:glutamate-5-semialdehyde dehydrogenase